MKKTLLFVHAVDTEGPISETLEDTFERLRLIFGVNLKPSDKMLEQLQQMKIDLRGKEAVVADCISPKRLSLFNNFEAIDSMLDRLFDQNFRYRLKDDFGKPYRFSWFCIDHVGFESNPRLRLLGYHAILHHYIERIRGTSEYFGDTVQWHYHSVPFNRTAHCFGLNWNFTNCHIEIFARRLIDYGLMPSAYRPGGWIERPDMNTWLEQWIPFDYGNNSLNKPIQQPDYKSGRFADWSRATFSWCGYHPSFRDYQVAGELKRTIFRCLSLDARVGSISEADIELAYEEAMQGKRPILSVTNHDNRDMVPEIEHFWSIIKNIARKFPHVQLKHCDEITAARESLSLRFLPELKLQIRWDENTLFVKSNHDIWGPQPFLAMKTLDGRYLHDNMAFHGDRLWSYTFDWMTIPKNALDTVALGSHDSYGNTIVVRLNMLTKKKIVRYGNALR